MNTNRRPCIYITFKPYFIKVLHCFPLITYISTGENLSLEKDAVDEKSLGPKMCSPANIDEVEVEGTDGRGKKTHVMCINTGLTAKHHGQCCQLPPRPLR